ncbi:MAG: paraquat-inducible protein A [Lysobacterales bacterium]
MLGALVLIPGLFFPVLTLDTLGTQPASYSVVTGIVRLFGADKYMLGLVVLAFSVVFPVAKLYWLLRYCLKLPLPFKGQWLLLLGKWSMLDVFVVAVIMGAGRLSLLSNFDSEPGVYWFGGAVALSMLGAELLLGVEKTALAGSGKRPRRDWLRFTRSVSAAILLVAGLSLPLMEISKWLFWENEYSVVSAMPELWQKGEWLLPTMLAVTVCIAPLLKLLFSASFSLTGSWSQLHCSEVASRWSMLSVFVLSILLVMMKLGDSTRVSAQLGFWLLLAGASLNFLDSRWIFSHVQSQDQPIDDVSLVQPREN